MEHHVTPLKTYYIVFALLLILLVATVLATQLEHGVFAIATALTIAVTKAVLIVWFFMHLNHSSSLTSVFAAAGFLWLVIMIGLMANDFVIRGPSLDQTPARSAATAPR